MTRSTRTGRWLSAIIVSMLVAAFGSAGITLAHGPDPLLSGGAFRQDQQLHFRWRSGAEPIATIKTAIKAAATDATDLQASRAATFVYDASGGNPIGYGIGATCGVNGLACFTRDAPNGFTMWLREQGHVFDWGTLKWCQTYSSPPNGCYDAETIALDEFGHVEGLGHHVNKDDDSDYLDAVVQTYSRTKPSTGWNVHDFGRCDTAALQMLYDLTSSTAKYSTCLDLATVLTLTASSTTIAVGSATTLTATLKVVEDTDYLLLRSNPVSARTVTLQRRAPGATTWTTIGPMSAGSTTGTYLLSQRPGATTEYRAVFATPSNEGINGNSSPAVRVSVGSCLGSTIGAAEIAAPCI